MKNEPVISLPTECSTRDVARALGLTARFVREMAEQGELRGWKTPGGRWRIARESVMSWLELRQLSVPGQPAAPGGPAGAADEGLSCEIVLRPRRFPQRVLLIEDSAHFQTLVKLLVGHEFPQVDLHVADDGIDGLVMAGRLEPDVLIVDILLPGIDGAALVGRLRWHPLFQSCQFIVITSLDEASRAPYAFALAGVSVMHKTKLVQDLPLLLDRALALPDAR
ncbi:excisionase family DNA-binding protein [Alicycliphilus denitrificans]|uniref:Response regulator n=1 Tax=Alicycliphilus denitrificans TaxID=179636 RepID=A0A420KC60_9BURK|nr:excisionase family DNA-binding protein [Alicycliphilus denitrificans]RKJ96802.1 response regulator [Alicycliphilus denitrificans]